MDRPSPGRRCPLEDCYKPVLSQHLLQIWSFSILWLSGGFLTAPSAFHWGWCVWSCWGGCIGPTKHVWDAAVISPLSPLLCLLISIHFSGLAIMVINNTITISCGHLYPCAERCCLRTCAVEYLHMGAGLGAVPQHRAPLEIVVQGGRWAGGMKFCLSSFTLPTECWKAQILLRLSYNLRQWTCALLAAIKIQIIKFYSGMVSVKASLERRNRAFNSYDLWGCLVCFGFSGA